MVGFYNLKLGVIVSGAALTIYFAEKIQIWGKNV